METISRIYCYHEEMGNPDGEALISLWKTVWGDEGWTPLVLGLNDAKAHPAYSDLVNRVSKWPTKNDRKFEVACFVRWCAFALINGSAVVADNDVFPRVEFPPQPNLGFVCADPCGGPGFMYGTGEDFSNILELFLRYSPSPADLSNGHISDMTILHGHERSGRCLYKVVPTMANYGTAPWLDWPLTHFGNAYLKTGLPRSKEVSQVLKLNPIQSNE